jgi:hypothetical protein
MVELELTVKTKLNTALSWLDDALNRITQSLQNHTPLDRVDLSDSVRLARIAVIEAKKYESKRRRRRAGGNRHTRRSAA